MNSTKKGYRIPDAGTYIGVSKSCVWLYIKQGKLQAHKLSDRVTIIYKEDLDNFMAGV
jgi:predicted DNA-binding transcriptional regulator AlpA